MTTDDLAYLSSIDSRFLKDLKLIIKNDYSALTPKGEENLLKCLKKGGKDSYAAVAKSLLVMDIEQMGAVLSSAIKNDLRGVKALCDYIADTNTPINTKLASKVRTINTQSIVKNTIVDTNVLKLKKTIRNHA